MKPYSLLLVAFFSSLSFCDTVIKEEKEILSLELIKKQKKGPKRDFLINEFLKQETTTQNQAFETLQYIDSMNTNLFTNFALRYKHDETLAVVQCQNMPTKQLINSYADCIKLGLSYKEATQLNTIELRNVINKVSSKYPDFAKNLSILSSAIPFTKIVTLSSENFYELYFSLPVEFRQKHLNYKLPRKTFFKIYEDKENFEKYLKLNIINRDFDIVNESFLSINDESLSYEASLLLGLNAFIFDDNTKANMFLLNALNKVDEKNLNKTLFWLYKISNNRFYLNGIINNTNTNDLYTSLSYKVLNSDTKLKPTKQSVLAYFEYLSKNTQEELPVFIFENSIQ